MRTHRDWCKAKQKERICPGEWRKPHPAHSLEGLGAACLPAALGLRAALDFESLGWVFFRSSSGYFSLLPRKWRLARFLASGLHLFQGNICRLVQASRRIVAACPARVAPWGEIHPAWLRLLTHPSPSPRLLLRRVTRSHHGTRGLTQADLCSAQLLLAPSFPLPSNQATAGVTGAPGWNYSSPANVYFKSLSFNI